MGFPFMARDFINVAHLKIRNTSVAYLPNFNNVRMYKGSRIINDFTRTAMAIHLMYCNVYTYENSS